MDNRFGFPLASHVLAAHDQRNTAQGEWELQEVLRMEWQRYQAKKIPVVYVDMGEIFE